MYEQNTQLQQVQQFDFYKGMKFPQAIKKISYFDDAVYINFGKGQMIALPKNWLQKQEHWSAFQGFLKVELDPKAK